MGLIHNILMGFGVAFEPMNLFFCFVGVLAGTLVGVLPGIGPTAAMALLLPVTFAVPTSASIIMLAGILYGAMYGGSTTSILVNIPENPQVLLPVSMDTRWPVKAEQGRLLVSLHGVLSLREP